MRTIQTPSSAPQSVFETTVHSPKAGTPTQGSSHVRPTRRWWLESQVAWLVLLVVVVFFSRMTTLTIRGEESRRARVAIEMLESGDWIVPREQGRLFPDRPPLGNWLIALSMLATGSHGLLAVRLPTVIATLLTTLLVYGYSRTFLSRTGALAAGAAYATMVQVLQLGRLAETEATMTLCVGASLLIWHWGYCRGWPAARTWTAGYALAGLAALAKGPQGPIYFAGAVLVYLALRRDRRFLLSGSHLAGIAVFAVVVGAWQAPYSLAVPWSKVLQTWGHTSAQRFDFSQHGSVVMHLLTYPCEVFACLLPWSIWLIGLSNRELRQSLGSAREPLVFLCICIVVAFPTCWLAPQARTRYFMPLYPCFAPLIGLVVERALAAARGSSLERMWRTFMTAAAGCFVAAGLAIVAASCLASEARTPLVQPLGFAVVYFLLAAAAAAVVWRARAGVDARRGQAAVLALASFVGLSFTGAVLNSLVPISEHTAERVAELRRRLPPGTRLVSLGRAHHSFVYHYGETIPWLDWPKQGDPKPAYEYFCFHSMNGRRKPLPFAWREIAAISCDRSVRANPVDVMVVGRNLMIEPAAKSAPNQSPPWRR
ncbi:MAG TPA: glycosyltransferase family 39 protein [Pirellulales bacterium]|nr:glycosyltransferase family 39 protein [Pirellulales bacterium]